MMRSETRVVKGKVCAEPTRNQIEALPVLGAGLDLAGEQVEFDRLAIGLEDRNDTIDVWIIHSGATGRRRTQCRLGCVL